MKVLDYGNVELLDTMGDDCSPAEAARVSYNNPKRGWDKGDGKLTNYLLENSHLSPFEMNELKFRVKAPIFVARQWMRHRAASYNEFSMRYSEAGKVSDSDTVELYLPKDWGMGSGGDKQSPASMRELPEARSKVRDLYERSVHTYAKLLELGVSNEHARLVLPVSTYTVFLFKTNLRNFWHFLELRLDEHAQCEIRQYAEAMEKLAANKFPNLMKTWQDVRSK